MKTFRTFLVGVLFVSLFSTSCTKEPTACFTVAQETVSLGQNVVCDASCSVDAEKYIWTANTSIMLKTGGTDAVKQEVIFDTTGVFTITLTVENGSKQAEVSKTVTVVP